MRDNIVPKKQWKQLFCFRVITINLTREEELTLPLLLGLLDTEKNECSRVVERCADGRVQLLVKKI